MDGQEPRPSISIITQNHVVLRDTMTPVNAILGHFLGTFFDHCAHPDAQISGHNVGQTETGHAFEFVDVELQEEFQ